MAKSSEHVLIIDCQLFQTDAWHRGMGKYSLSFLTAVFRNQKIEKYQRVVFVFNKNLAMPDDCKAALKEICKTGEFSYLPLADVHNKRITRYLQHNKDLISQYLEKTFNNNTNIDYLVLSLFLGEATCVVFPKNTRNILLFYDLIPLLYSERYIPRIVYEDYLANFEAIFEADLILTISQTVANDMAVYLGIPERKLVSIDGAPINRKNLKAVKPDIDVGTKFILMPSGDELRKNNLRAVKSFDRFSAANKGEYKLVLTSFFSPKTIEELNHYSDNLVFTGNVSEAELLWLYKYAELVLFATEYEGLGLPVLEAMTVGKKIACSDIPVFREISTSAFYYFNHLEPENIAEVMTIAVGDSLSQKRKETYKRILKKYTWPRTASLFLDAVDTLSPQLEEKQKPKIAIFTPHPAGYSAIGKVVAESHAAMTEEFEVEYYFDYGLYHKEVRPEYLSAVARCYDAIEFNAKRYADYDAVVYHIGNSDYHLETIKNALHLPGFLILHDTFLHGAYSRTQVDGYMTEKRVELERQLSDRIDPPTSSFLTTLLNASLGVLCHSEYAEKAAKQVLANPETIVKTIDLPLAAPFKSFVDRSKEGIKIGFAGILADVKGLEIINHIAHDVRFEQCTINLFGYDFLKPESINQLSKLPRVNLITNPSDFEFQTLLSQQDILVNFRLEYRGETSLTVLEAMRYGVVPIVRNVGWYREMPESALARVDNLDDVVRVLEDLITHPAKRSVMSSAGVALVRRKYSHELYAQTLKDIIGNTSSNTKNGEVAALIKSGAPLKKILASL
ncbi:MAG: glycosyltransferase [Patescibacteria group bacterium]